MSVENPKLSPEQFHINQASESIRAMADEMKDELKPATRGLEPALRRLAENGKRYDDCRTLHARDRLLAWYSRGSKAIRIGQ
jgi:hypothetical protein